MIDRVDRCLPEIDRQRSTRSISGSIYDLSHGLCLEIQSLGVEYLSHENSVYCVTKHCTLQPVEQARVESQDREGRSTSDIHTCPSALHKSNNSTILTAFSNLGIQRHHKCQVLL